MQLANIDSTSMPIIRPPAASDSLNELTALLHTACASRAAQGWNVTAVDQPVDVTRERLAGAHGFTQIALDTAEPATALRRRYERRGDVSVGGLQWQGKTHASVLMAKTPAPLPIHPRHKMCISFAFHTHHAHQHRH